MSPVPLKPTLLKLSVRSLLCGLVAVAALPPLIFAGVVLFRYADTQREQTEQVLVDSARGVARSVDAEFGAVVAALTALSTSPALLTGDIGGFEARLRGTPLQRGRGFLLFDMGGRAVIDTTAAPGAAPGATSSGGKTWPVPVFNDRPFYVSPVIPAAGGGQPCAMIAIPVASDDGRRWSLATFLTSDDFAELLREPGVPADWVISVVDASGTHLRRSHLNERFAGRPMVPELVRLAQSRHTAVLRTTTLEGIPVISTVVPAPASGWALGMALPVSQLQAPFHESLRWLGLVGAVLIGLSMVLAFLVAHLLLKGVRRLNAAAATVGQGGILVPQPSPLWEVDGILGTLAQVSKRLAEKREELTRINDTLEMQVGQRTAALTAEMARREASEAQLRQLHKMDAIGKLTGGIAHDFNNMLAVVMSGMQLVKRRLARGDTDVGGLIDSALQGAENAARLIERLLAFSRQ